MPDTKPSPFDGFLAGLLRVSFFGTFIVGFIALILGALGVEGAATALGVIAACLWIPFFLAMCLFGLFGFLGQLTGKGRTTDMYDSYDSFDSGE